MTRSVARSLCDSRTFCIYRHTSAEMLLPWCYHCLLIVVPVGFLGRIAVLCTRRCGIIIVTDGVPWSVRLSVGRSVTIVTLQKWLNCLRCRLGCGLGWTRGTIIRWGPDTRYKGAVLRGMAAHCKVSGLSAVSYAKTAEPIEMPFGMWTAVGPRSM